MLDHRVEIAVRMQKPMAALDPEFTNDDGDGLT